MKRLRKILAMTLALAAVTVSLSLPSAFANDASSSPDGHVLSETIDAFPTELGLEVGEATSHGNNQTRILSTDHGVYITTPLRDYIDEHNDKATEVGLWRINPDNSVELLWKDIFYYVAAGTTSYVMADRDGNVWVATSWDIGSFYILIAWEWNIKTNEMTKYMEQKYYRRGNNYGKHGCFMDVEYNRIYNIAMGGDYSPGHIVWYYFDIDTKTWSDHHYAKTGCMGFYHYGYADGKGGFFTVYENTYSIGSGQSNIEGLRVSEAVKTYHSRQIDANFIWETAHILYIPNAEVDAAYDYTLVPSSMDVEKGLYPNDYNAENDLFWDKETGLLYVIATIDDNGDYGRVKHLFVMDTNQPAAEEQLGLEAPFKIVYHTDLRFLYGFNTQYFQHFYKDTEGNLYLIAVSNNSSEIEIWKAESATDPSAGFRLVHTEPFRGYADASKGTVNVYGMIIATNRNNSLTGDKAHLITYKTDVKHWFYYTVDFAALRALLGI